MKKRRHLTNYSPSFGNNILFQKYQHLSTNSSKQYYLQNINNFIQKQSCHQTIQLEDIEMWIDNKQYLKRQYSLDQFKNKIQAIAQYYKFQINIPDYFDNPIYKITKKYKSQVDRIKRKQIKKYMKENHGVQVSSLNTFSQQSQNTSQYQQNNKKSKYSNKLSKIYSNRTSFMLQGICYQINYALKNVYSPNIIKGKFESKEQSFRNFIGKKNQRIKQAINKLHCINRYSKKKDQNKYQSNHPFQRKFNTKSANNIRKAKPKSFSRGTFNETASRQDIKNCFRRKRIKKSKTKSQIKIVPEVSRTESKTNLGTLKRETHKNQPTLMFDKSIHCFKRRLNSGKTRKQNQDLNKFPKLPSIAKLKPKHSIEGLKSKKLIKGMRPSTSNLKSRSNIKASPYKINHQTIQIFPKKQNKGIESLIRKKLQIR